MAENYMNDQNVRDYYDRWIHSPTLLDHVMDRERFYMFVKACVNYVGHPDVAKKINLEFLRDQLFDDFCDGRTDKAYEGIKHKIISLFEILIEYENTPSPMNPSRRKGIGGIGRD